MRVHERLFLNPFEKMVRHGIPPVKFVLHVTLVVLLTIQVSVSLHQDIVHCFHVTQHLSTLLLGNSDGSEEYMLPQNLREAVESTLRKSFAIQENTFNDMRPFVHEYANPEFSSLPVHVVFRNASIKDVIVSRSELETAAAVSDYLSVVLPCLYGEDIRFLRFLSISFGIYETVLVPLGMPLQHYVWYLNVTFDGSYVGTFEGHLSYKLNIPPADNGNELPRYYLDAAVLVLAILSIVLVLKRVCYSCRVLFAVRQKSSKGLSYGDAAALFNWWWLMSLASHAVQVCVAIYCLSTTSPDAIFRFSLLGWSCALSWINICQYFEHFPGFYVGFTTTAIGIVSVAKYTLSVFPILTAFTILGTCLFWKAEFFKSFSASYASLFALLNGDIVHDAFNALWEVAGLGGHMFLYVFIFVFIYIVLKVNIMIIEEAYLAARSQGFKYERHHEEMTANLKRQESPGGSDPGTGVSARRLIRRTFSKSRLWRLSPRFWDSQGLQRALTETFDEEDSDASAELLTAETPTAASLNTGAANVEVANAAGPDPDDWWQQTLPQWTQLLRARALPNCGDEKLRQVFEDFVAAVAEVSEALDKHQSATLPPREPACSLS